MPVTTLSSREFDQDIGGARRAAEQGPVIISDRGKPSHVLLNVRDYQRLLGQRQRRTLIEALAMPGLSEIEPGPLHSSISGVEADLM